MADLYLDCAYGLGGDMFLAALAGLGLDLEPLGGLFRTAGVAVEAEVCQESRRGVAGCSLCLTSAELQPLRRLPDILGVLERLEVSDRVRERSAAAFRRLAQVEADVHGVPLDAVHFHEVGAVDTLVDVAGAFWGLEALGVGRVTASALPWFRGEVSCAHGILSLPAPAATRLLHGKPVRPSGLEGELVTPTGALLVDQIVDAFADGPQGRLMASSLAYGQRDYGGGLRAFLYDPDAMPEVERVWVLESNVDHLSGEDLGHFFQAVFEAGALDVLYLPGVMKKNRPGGALQAMCREPDLERVQEAFFRNSLCLGLRRSLVERVVLAREEDFVETPFGPVEAKGFESGGIRLSRPEYEALAVLARRTGRTVAELRLLLAGPATP